MVLLQSIKYVLLDYALNTFLSGISVNFTSFDMFDWCREFKILELTTCSDGNSFSISWFRNVKITNIYESRVGTAIEFEYVKNSERRFHSTLLTKIIQCIPNERLVLELDRNKYLKNYHNIR